jgi:hypothetical protein
MKHPLRRQVNVDNLKFDYLDGHRVIEVSREELRQRLTRKQLYGITTPRGDDLCAFDAYGMDVIEGRA